MNIHFIILGLLFNTSLFAQYVGGAADGFAWINLDQSEFIYQGGDQDGHSQVFLGNNNQYYTGGDSDGFSFFTISGNNAYYAGGDSDGFSNIYLIGNNYVYHGGDLDGYALANLYQAYIWKGTNGTGWNVMGNWSTNQIPTLRHNVIIPTGVSNYPAINAGTLSIGRNPNNANFLCHALRVDANAQMTTRVNCFVTLYGQMIIRGNLFVKNTSIDAFVVKQNGSFEVKGIGIATMGAN